MNFTAQYINIFLQFSLSVMLTATLYATGKQLKKSREETEELKKQVYSLLQRTTIE